MKHLFAGLLMALCAFCSSPVWAQQCAQTEQRGCLEIDILNLRAPVADPAVYAADPPVGKKAFAAYKSGEMQTAKERTFTIFFWNVNNISARDMAEYRLPVGYGRGSSSSQLTRHSVTEVPPVGGPTFDPSFDLGAPQRAFKVTAVGPGAALQVPWGMIRDDTYILICSGDADGVFPNRLTAKEGLWLTPADFREKRDYILTRPFLSKR